MDINKICLNCMAGTVGADMRCSACGKTPPAVNPASPALPPQTIIHGRYLLGATLGQGGFGITYVGFDLDNCKRIAVKEFFPSQNVTRNLNDKSVVVKKDNDYFIRCRQSFLNEAQMIYGFADHSNIVNIYHVFNENNTVYYIMEYLEGQTLDKMLKSLGTRITWPQLSGIVSDILNALETIHRQGFIHRDVSPDNIFILKNGRTKLIDFGASRYIRHPSELTIVLKKGFAPPEQYKTEGRQGPWTDIYALAATMYYCLTGCMIPEAPSRAMGKNIKSFSELFVNIEPNVSAAIMKALSLGVEGRFVSVQQFRNSLFNSAAEPQVQAPQKGWYLKITEGYYKGNTLLCKGNVTVGRNPAVCKLVYPERAPGISRQHMTFLFGRGSAFPGLRCDTASGIIYVNGNPLSGQGRVCKLSSGDVIVFGNNQKIIIESF